jgi:hypothetical protein
MGKIGDYIDRLTPLLTAPRRAGDVERLLVAESNLPGPRGNLEMAAAFAEAMAGAEEVAGWLPALIDWAAIGPQEAPTGDPREFLPFCAVVALGGLYGRHDCPFQCGGDVVCPRWPVSCSTAGAAIRSAGNDPRWRLREGAAMALQRVGEPDPIKLRTILNCWMDRGSFLDLRLVAAALAHPPLLADADLCRYALEKAEAILRATAATPPGERSREEFRVLVKGLSYALSVLAARLPAEGFALFERWISSPDSALRRILKENLKKRRLQAADPSRAAKLLAVLEDCARRG